MHYYLRNGTALCCLGWVTMGFALPGCTNRLGPVRATQNAGSIGHPNLPDIVVERSKECMEIYAPQLEPGRVALESTVEVNEDGDKVGVTLGGIPQCAPDFGACLRNVLHDVPIAEVPLHEAVETLKYRIEHANDGQDALRRFIEVIPGVPIVVSELVLEVEGYTVVLPVTVKVVAKQVKQVDLDKAILAKIGQLALDTVGYDEIMRQAELAGWVKWVPIKNAQSATSTQFLADGPALPNVQEIIKESFKQVMTKTAPVALGVSQLDTPAPGPADLLAVGIFAVSLVAVGGISVYIYATREDSPGPTSQPQPPRAPPPPPPPPPPRKYPNQTCENDEMARLEKAMHDICDKSYAAKCSGNSRKEKEMLAQIPCSAIKLSTQQRQACLAARWVVQNKCFGGKPDKIHKKPIDDHQQGLDNCEALKLLNCATGHPMAGK